jgi:hypothetical protein
MGILGGIGSASGAALSGVWNASMGVSDAVGTAAYSAAGAAPVAAGYAGAVGARMAKHVGNSVGSISSRLLDYKDGKFSMTTLGKGIVGAGGLAYALKDTAESLEKSRMGTMDGQVTTATPTPVLNKKPSFQDNGSATGDLVFALNNLRNG